MPYVVKWVDRVGALQESPRHVSPSDALRFSRRLTALRPTAVWAENDKGDRFPINIGRAEDSQESERPRS
jgi:hypothetical protein